VTSDRQLSIEDLADRWNMNVDAIRKRRARRQPMPPAIKIGNTVRWRLVDVEAFEDAHREPDLIPSLPVRSRRVS
jgi:hypothetical protein